MRNTHNRRQILAFDVILPSQAYCFGNVFSVCFSAAHIQLPKKSLPITGRDKLPGGNRKGNARQTEIHAASLDLVGLLSTWLVYKVNKRCPSIHFMSFW